MRNSEKSESATVVARAPGSVSIGRLFVSKVSNSLCREKYRRRVGIHARRWCTENGERCSLLG